jgi:hypothetical protein
MEDVQPLAKFIRLTNGDDLIADVVETEDEDGILYTVFNPLRVVYIDSEREGYTAIAFSHWVFSGLCDQQEFVIHAEDVMLIADLSEKMNKHYWDYLERDNDNKEKSRMDKIKEAADIGYDEDLYSMEKKVYH